jgi:tRNA threonylcarbamoyladenosine biosynthesis protein TsaB
MTIDWMLAIDTSTESAGLALVGADRYFELNWMVRREGTRTVMARIDDLLRMAEVEREEIGALAVAIGPGSFSGLRVGLSIAKGWAVATGLPIFGVSTLAVTVQPWAGSGRTLGVIRAGRSRYVWACSDRLNEADSGPIADLYAAVAAAPGVIVAGEIDPADVEQLRTAGAAIPDAMIRTRRALSIVELATARWQAGESDNLQSLEPVYVHGRIGEAGIAG